MYKNGVCTYIVYVYMYNVYMEHLVIDPGCKVDRKNTHVDTIDLLAITHCACVGALTEQTFPPHTNLIVTSYLVLRRKSTHSGFSLKWRGVGVAPCITWSSMSGVGMVSRFTHRAPSFLPALHSPV